MRAYFACGLCASMLVILGACGSCTGASIAPVPDAGADRWVWRPTPPGPRDGEVESTDSDVCEAKASDWPGWRRFSELDPCCPLDVAEPGTIGEVRWKSCETDAGASADGGDAGLALWGPVGQQSYQFTAWNLTTGRPLGAWRDQSANTRCQLSVIPGQTTATLLGVKLGPGRGLYVAQGAWANLGTGVRFAQIAGPELLGRGMQEVYASDTKLAFDLEPEGTVVQHRFGTNTVIQTRGGGPLFLDFVERDDVFASSSARSTWDKEYVVNDGGQLTLYAAKAYTHVSAFATDGTNIVWSETSVNLDPDSLQPNLEVWTAPYTSDPTQRAATARKVTTITGSYRAPPLDGHRERGVLRGPNRR